MRISKAPEVRKQEMIDTAMRLFARKGYEATSMTDIAKEMHVVSGLCYRYFSSKEELYNTALQVYGKENAASLIAILNREDLGFEEIFMLLGEHFIMTDGKEKYYNFFHKSGNEMFHRELEMIMNKELLPHIISLLKRTKEKEQFQIDDVESTAKFLLYGQMPILNDNSLGPEEKFRIVTALCKKVLY